MNDIDRAALNDPSVTFWDYLIEQEQVEIDRLTAKIDLLAQNGQPFAASLTSLIMTVNRSANYSRSRLDALTREINRRHAAADAAAKPKSLIHRLINR